MSIKAVFLECPVVIPRSHLAWKMKQSHNKSSLSSLLRRPLAAWWAQAYPLKLAHPDSKVHGATMGPIWDRQDQGGPHVGPMNFAIWRDCVVFFIWFWFHKVCAIRIYTRHIYGGHRLNSGFTSNHVNENGKVKRRKLSDFFLLNRNILSVIAVSEVRRYMMMM